MKLPHPIRRIRNFVEAVQLTVLNFQKLLLTLRLTIEHNTAAQQETAKAIDGRLAAIEAAAKPIQEAAGYLAAAERHARQQSGQRHEF